MRLFEAIMEANHRALAGDAEAGVRPADFPGELPVAALTCIDARLNALFPDALGLPKEQFIWLRNAGNIITGPMSSTMRSLALACAVKGAREIAIIGHTDCMVRKTSTTRLTEAFEALGVQRGQLPENLTDFFGLFASEQQNVMKAVGFVRQSPLIGPKVPVHGLMVDVTTGRLEWVVNGYQTLDTAATPQAPLLGQPDQHEDALKNFASFNIGEMKYPDMKIGEIATSAPPQRAPDIGQPEASPTASSPAPPPPKAPPIHPPPVLTPKIPYPPRIRGR